MASRMLVSVLAAASLLVSPLLSYSTPPTQAEASARATRPIDAPVAASMVLSYAPGELILSFRPEAVDTMRLAVTAEGEPRVGLATIDALYKAHRVRVMAPVFPGARRPAPGAMIALPEGALPAPDLNAVYRLELSPDADILAAVKAFGADSNIRYAEPNFLYQFDGAPDDTFFGQQWYLDNLGQYVLYDADIDAPEAWAVVTGTSSTVIAVIDTGMDRDHPDLNDQVWINPGETPGDSIDNDGNGYIDDAWGWNWVSNLSDPDDYEYNDPRDDNGHGTHVAGIAAAETNNGAGVAGVCWNCRVMALKAFDSRGVGAASDIAAAISYAATKGADIINMSFGSYANSLLMQDALAAAYGQAVLVAAAGNDGRTPKAMLPFYPAAHSYVIGVGATDVGCALGDPGGSCQMVAEMRAAFSNHGVNAKVGAPGVSIYSTFPGGYASLAGTSMAAPIVSGLAGLILSQHPTWSREKVRGQILKTSDAIFTGEFGRVNAHAAVTAAPLPDLRLDAPILYGDSSGDGDGIPDAGETFTITVPLKNYWGEALTTTAILSATDPYLTILSGTAAYGDISAYATLRNTVTPFRAALAANAPNNHRVDLLLAVSANAGAYSVSGEFSFLVQRGIEIPDPLFPAVITRDMTLRNDYLYIVKQNMLVAQGVTLTIEPGTRLQFDAAKMIKVQGTLIASGTEELPIHFTSNQKDPQPGDFKGIVFAAAAADAILDQSPLTMTLATEGAMIPGVGTMIAVSDTPRFDGIGDVYFSAVFSGTPNYTLILHWYNGIGVVEASSVPLPSGLTTNAFSETVFLAGDAGQRSIVFSQPSDQYVSGSILNHVILEYGGGLVLESAYPYVSNNTFRHNKGAAFTGESCALGIVALDRSEFGELVFARNRVVDNVGRGLYVRNAHGRVVIAQSELSRNVPGSYCVNISDQSGGASLTGPITFVDSEARYNQLSYSQNLDGSGICLYGSLGRILRSHISDNVEPYQTANPAGLKLEGGPHVIRGNTLSGNRKWGGAPEQGEDTAGGSAMLINGASALVSFNTVIGNRAYPVYVPLPDAAILMYNYPGQSENQLTRNNILANDVGGLYDVFGQPIPQYDLYLSNYQNTRRDVIATHNYWGTTTTNVIRYDMIYDYDNDFAQGTAQFEPFLTAPEPLAPGFLFDAFTTPPSPIGAQAMTLTLDFSRDMNTAITPTVTFGVDEPFTQNRIQNGVWVSATRWAGSYLVTADTGDGVNTLKVSGARDSAGMEIPTDTRFGFVIQTAGTASILLEALAGVSNVRLNWTQNDVTDLAGYILYRSPHTNTGYVQVGDGMMVGTSYTDTAVTNGVTYYYKYSVLDTDFNEVAFSNEVSVTPDDYTPPVTPVVSDDGATTPYFDRLRAGWSSSDLETGIVEYQICAGAAPGACDTVSWTSMGALTQTIRLGLSLVDGQTYYVSVKARNSANHWSAIGVSDGITLNRLPAPVVVAAQPISGVRTASQIITLTGSGFHANPPPVVRIGNIALGSVSVLSSTRLSAAVPAMIAAGVYTATVENFDTQIGALVRAYTATNPAVGPRPVLLSPNLRRIGDDEAGATVDVIVQEAGDLGAFQFELNYDAAIVTVSNVTLGAFLGSGGRNVAALGPTIDNTGGALVFGGFSYGAAPGASGSGTLATITFAPVITGATGLTLTHAQLRDTLNSSIPVDLQNGAIQVVGYPFGDFDRNCLVEVSDIMVVASRWNSHTGEPEYDARYDFDSDGDIDVADIMQVAAVWGSVCSGGTGILAQRAGIDGPALRLASDSFAPQSGEVFSLTLRVESASDLSAYQVAFVHDAGLEIVNVTYTTLLAGGGNTVRDLGPDLDETNRRLTLGGFGYGGARGLDGAGALAVIQLRAIASGPHQIAPEGALLVDHKAALIAPSAVAGWSSGIRLFLPLTRR